jgi:hypothetical protein
MVDDLAAPQPTEDFVLLVQPFSGNDGDDGLPDDLGRRVPNMRSAAGFHDTTIPSSVLLTIASWACITMAAR